MKPIFIDHSVKQLNIYWVWKPERPSFYLEIFGSVAVNFARPGIGLSWNWNDTLIYPELDLVLRDRQSNK